MRNLTKRFGGVAAVGGLSLDCAEGEVFGFVGPDGAGKTTIMRLMAAVMTPDEGSIVIEGVDVVAAPELARSHISYMPQRFGLYEDLTVDENIEFFADLFGIERRAATSARRACSRLGHDAVPQAPRRAIVGRNEAEAWADLLAHPYAQGAAARRADRRRRSGLAARLLAHPLWIEGRGRRDHHCDLLSRRSRALHPARAPAKRAECSIATRPTALKALMPGEIVAIATARAARSA